MDQSFLDIIVLIGTIQGLVCAGVLFMQKNDTANRYLAWILVIIAVACLNLYLLNTITFQSDWLAILAYCIPLVVVMPLGPLVYSYVISFDRQTAPLPKWHFHAIWLDMLPSILSIGFFTGLIFGLFDKAVFQSIDQFIDHYNKYVDIPRWLSLSVYLWMAYRFNQKAHHKSLKWTRQFVLGFAIFQVIWLLFLIPYIIPDLSDSLLSWLNWYPVYLPLVVLTYWLGINAFLHRNSHPSPLKPDRKIEQQTMDTLIQLMEEEKLYRDPALRLDAVVTMTNIPQKTVSSVLNQLQGKTFNRFVNEYRIAEVKERLTDPAFGHLTITGIALESGFNSRATFQRIFKELEGESPSAWRSKKVS